MDTVRQSALDIFQADPHLFEAIECHEKLVQERSKLQYAWSGR